MGQIADRLKRQRGGRVEHVHRDDKGFRERLDAAAEAKKALLEKFRAQAAPDDPEVVERQAVRQAVSVAREGREAARTAADGSWLNWRNHSARFRSGIFGK